MKKLLSILALLCVLGLAPALRAQTYPVTYNTGGNITATNSSCIPTACVGIGLPSPAAAVITVGITGTFSATLAVEESQDGINFTSAGTSLTSTGTTSYVIAGFTQFRVRASAYSSGNAGVNFQVSNAPTGGVTSGTADPTGNTCAANQLYVQTTTGNLYSCDAGVFAKVGGSGGTVTAVTGTAPIVSSGGTAPAISCPTCNTSAAAITNNVLAKGSGGAQGLQNSLATDDGTTFTYAGTGGVSSAPSGVNGKLTLGGSSSGTATITAPAVAGTATNPVVSSNAMLFPGGSAANPAVAITGSGSTTNYGFYNAGTAVDVTLAGVLAGFWSTGAINEILLCNSSSSFGTNGDTCLSRDATRGSGYFDLGTGATSNTSGFLQSAGVIARGTTFTASGCGNTTLVGGATTGKYTSVTAGSCTITITMGNTGTAPTGWVCDMHDITTPADSANITLGTTNATTAAFVEGTVAANDVIAFKCTGY